jgi:hypothetical protein
MIHALPGMGADHPMFTEPWGTLPAFVAQDWPPSNSQGARTPYHGDGSVGVACGGVGGDPVICIIMA